MAKRVTITSEDLAMALVHKIFFEHQKPDSMNERGVLRTTSIPKDQIRQLARDMVDDALDTAHFKGT